MLKVSEVVQHPVHYVHMILGVALCYDFWDVVACTHRARVRDLMIVPWWHYSWHIVGSPHWVWGMVLISRDRRVSIALLAHLILGMLYILLRCHLSDGSVGWLYRSTKVWRLLDSTVAVDHC